jgi:hypothetical protein
LALMDTSGSIANSDSNRVQFWFRDQAGQLRGAASYAVYTD